MLRVLNFWSLFLISLAIGAASAGLPFLTNRNDVLLMMEIALPLCLAWLACVGFTFFRFGWRALWLVVGAPLTFWWPFSLVMIAVGCAQNSRNCP